jgi:hypothetical protein
MISRESLPTERPVRLKFAHTGRPSQGCAAARLRAPPTKSVPFPQQNELIPARKTSLIIVASRPTEGAFMRRHVSGTGCGACARASQARARGAPGSRPTLLRGSALRWAGRGPDERRGNLPGSGRANAPRPAPEARPRGGRSRRGEAPKGAPAGGSFVTLGRRLRRCGGRPDREAGHGCGVPHQRFSRPLKATGAAERWLCRLFDN